MKRYIRAANVADIQGKIAKKKADIEKKQAWIEKKELAIEKKLKLLSGLLDSATYDRLVARIEYLKNNDSYRSTPDYASINTWQLARENGWDYETPQGKALYSIDEDAESIYRSKENIKELQGSLDKFKSQLDAIKKKDAEIDEIPECLKEFMNGIIEDWNDYDFNIKNNGKPFYRDLYHKAWVILYGETSSGSGAVAKAKLEELYPDFVERWGETRRDRFDFEYITRPFEKEYGSLKYAQSIWDLPDEKIRANNERDGKNLILDLLKRVTKVTGSVVDWSGLHLTRGNVGAVLNGVVIGEEGKARVESIYAEGPVQRLHIRTLVKPIRG